MTVVGGLIVLVVVLAAASAAGFGLRSRQGRFLAGKSKSASSYLTDPADSPRSASANVPLTAAALGAPLGERATLVQFSTEFCTYCGPTRELLTEVARERDGVAFIEVDAAQRMDLTRRLRVLSTPTILVLNSGGAIERRSSGQPRKPELLAAVRAVLDQGLSAGGE